MYSLIRPLLFALPPERAHQTAMALFKAATVLPFWCRALRQRFGLRSAHLERRYWGLTFANPVGLAAGFDKDGRYLQALSCLGFGFLEVGTVTPRPQAGNPRPRLFRLPADRALINRMGFNNDGAQALAHRLEHWRQHANTEALPILGVNIGKNKDTPNEQATDDYLNCFHTLAPWADYFAINVSSPNTPGLRDLQSRQPLLHLLEALQNANQRLPQPKPLLLKIAPDVDAKQLDEIALIARQTQIAGLIATNTTLSRRGLHTHAHHLEAIGSGGLSGAPLQQRSTEIIRDLRQRLGPQNLIIGVGGIDSPEAAQAKLQAGADLIQVYTGLIYEGPGLIRRILQRMAEMPSP